MNLVTLAQLKRYLGLDSTFTSDDALLTRLLIEAEAWSERQMQRVLKPVIETRHFDWPGQDTLYFNDDLLELISVTNGDSTSVSLSDLAYIPRRTYPKFGISLNGASSVSWTYSTKQEDAIALAGVWGYHDNYSAAWVDSLDKVTDAGGINASVTTISVGNVDGANINNDTPRFSAGMLIKIESEWCEVTAATNSTTDTLTVKRGALGSTAATHALNTPIYVFEPARNVTGAITAYVHWRYNQKNNRSDYGNEVPKDITDLLPAPQGAYL